MSAERRGRTVFALALAALALGAGALLLHASPNGLGVSGDSVHYIAASRNLLAGRGLSRPTGGGEVRPLTHFPPLYPLTLTLPQLAGLDAPDGARLLSALLVAVNVALIGVLGRAIAGRLAGLFAASLAAVSPVVFSVHSWAMSEPLYLALNGGALLLTAAAAARPRLHTLALAALAAAGAALTRYAGLSLAAAGAAALLLAPVGALRRRLAQAAAFAALAIAPAALWSLRNLALTGTAANRQLVWHPPSSVLLKRPLVILWEWLVPWDFTYLVLYAMLAAALGLLALGAFTVRRLGWARLARALRAAPALLTLLLTLAAYAGLLAVSLLFFDATIPLDARITSPLYVGFLVLLGGVLAAAVRRGGLRRLLALAALAGLLLSYGVRTAVRVERLRYDAPGYSTGGIRNSPTLAALMEMPPETVIYTNEPEAVYYVTGRGAYMIPLRYDAVTTRDVPDYPEKLAAMRAALLDGGAVLVVFDTLARRPEAAPLEEMAAGLVLLYRGSDGAIYGAPPQ